jgi:hypothetical protein
MAKPNWFPPMVRHDTNTFFTNPLAIRRMADTKKHTGAEEHTVFVQRPRIAHTGNAEWIASFVPFSGMRDNLVRVSNQFRSAF